MGNLNLTVNGLSRSFQIANDDKLLNVLRDNGIKSVKGSCKTASCGNCTVLIDGTPVLSCSYLAIRAEGKEVTTVEGILDEVKNLVEFFNQEGAIQCGFCNSSAILTTYAMKKELGSNLTDNQINHYLNGNLCRCSGYASQKRAIKKFLGGKK